MKYRYVSKEQRVYPGLPAQDFDDSDLSPEQKATLDAALAAGDYEPARAPKATVTEKPTND